jgi:uncharacterized membrane protein
MMFVVMHTLFKELPHAEQISTLYVLCYGAMAFSTFLQFLGTLFGLSAFMLIFSSFGLALALVTPFSTTVWLLHDKRKQMLRNQHRAKLVSADRPMLP